MKTIERKSLVQQIFLLSSQKHPKKDAYSSDAPTFVEEPSIFYESINWLDLIRKGIPYDVLELVGKKANISIRHFLEILDIPQTTYNKKKREQSLLNSRDTELILAIAEVLDYGTDVFNQEEDKFSRWLKKSNSSLGYVSPESLFDTYRGVQEVRNCLERLEYGVMA